MSKSIIKRCFHKPKKIMTIQGVDYYSSDKRGIMYFKGDLVVNLTGEPNISPSNVLLPELDKHFEFPFKELLVTWPDFDLPMVRPTFWKALHSAIMKNNWRKICIHCAAGHGRTGTALSSMLIANMGYKSYDAVNFVREEHCESAVETESQCAYLASLDFYYNDRDPDGDNYPEPSMFKHYYMNEHGISIK